MTEADWISVGWLQRSVIDAVAPDALGPALATPLTGVVPRPASRPTALR